MCIEREIKQTWQRRKMLRKGREQGAILTEIWKEWEENDEQQQNIEETDKEKREERKQKDNGNHGNLTPDDSGTT